MRSKIIKILLFLFIGLECLAITNREKIEKDLKRLNIDNASAIAQTILMDEKMGVEGLRGEEMKVYLKEVKKWTMKKKK